MLIKIHYTTKRMIMYKIIPSTFTFILSLIIKNKKVVATLDAIFQYLLHINSKGATTFKYTSYLNHVAFGSIPTVVPNNTVILRMVIRQMILHQHMLV